MADVPRTGNTPLERSRATDDVSTSCRISVIDPKRGLYSGLAPRATDPDHFLGETFSVEQQPYAYAGPRKGTRIDLRETSLTCVHILHCMISATRPFTRAQSRETPKLRPGLRQKLVPAEQYANESHAKHWPGLRQKLVPAEQSERQARRTVP